MPKFLIKWKVDSQMMPTSPEELMKLLQSMNERVKALITSGEIEIGVSIVTGREDTRLEREMK